MIDLVCNFNELPEFLLGLGNNGSFKREEEKEGGKKMMTYANSKTSFDWV